MSQETNPQQTQQQQHGEQPPMTIEQTLNLQNQSMMAWFQDLQQKMSEQMNSFCFFGSAVITSIQIQTQIIQSLSQQVNAYNGVLQTNVDLQNQVASMKAEMDQMKQEMGRMKEKKDGNQQQLKDLITNFHSSQMQMKDRLTKSTLPQRNINTTQLMQNMTKMVNNGTETQSKPSIQNGTEIIQPQVNPMNQSLPSQPKKTRTPVNKQDDIGRTMVILPQQKSASTSHTSIISPMMPQAPSHQMNGMNPPQQQPRQSPKANPTVLSPNPQNPSMQKSDHINPIPVAQMTQATTANPMAPQTYPPQMSMNQFPTHFNGMNPQSHQPATQIHPVQLDPVNKTKPIPPQPYYIPTEAQ